jgi:hypothetical protein
VKGTAGTSPAHGVIQFASPNKCKKCLENRHKRDDRDAAFCASVMPAFRRARKPLLDKYLRNPAGQFLVVVWRMAP